MLGALCCRADNCWVVHSGFSYAKIANTLKISEDFGMAPLAILFYRTHYNKLRSESKYLTFIVSSGYIFRCELSYCHIVHDNRGVFRN